MVRNAQGEAAYQQRRKENDLQIEVYDAQLRELDGQVGIWWQVDPKTEDYEMWSPYVSNYDNPIRYSDPLGDEGEDCCGGWLPVKIWINEKIEDLKYRAESRIGDVVDLFVDTKNQAAENFENRKAAGVLPWQDPIAAFGHPMTWIGPPVGRGGGMFNTFRTELGPAVVTMEIRVVSTEVKATTSAGLNTVVNAQVNGNSKQSTKPQHNYDVKNTQDKNKVVKTGTSGGKETKTGESYRGNSQANKWNKEEKAPGKYKSTITNRTSGGTGARQKALDYEANRAKELKDQLDPKKHKRP